MKTLSQIMTEAHKIAKTLEGDYRARLSEGMRISHKNAKDNFTPDFIKIEAAQLHKKSVKEIFDIINYGYSRHSCYADEIYRIVMEKSEGFHSDLAKKSLIDYADLTYKQAWCVAYEFKRLSN